jgi:hypothetical protein
LFLILLLVKLFIYSTTIATVLPDAVVGVLWHEEKESWEVARLLIFLKFHSNSLKSALSRCEMTTRQWLFPKLILSWLGFAFCSPAPSAWLGRASFLK